MGQSARILRAHTLGDMYHDTLRGDVYWALYASAKGAEKRDQGLASVKEHAKAFRDTIENIARDNTSETLAKSLTTLRPVLDAYIEEAQEISAKAFSDRAAAERALPHFEEQFSKLEAQMEAAGDLIKSLVGEIESRAQASRTEALWQSGIGAAGTLLLILIGYVWIRRQFVQPVRQMAHAIGQVKEGASDIVIPGLKRHDEIGEVARSVEHISSLGRDNKLTVSALNGSDTMIMITDPDDHVAFVSAALVELLMRLEPAFRAARHDFSVEKMHGQHADYYRENPALRRTLIHEDSKSRKLRYEVGSEVLLVEMSYVYSIEGDRIGNTMLWRNMTNELQGQAEIAAVVEAARAGDFSKRLPVEGKLGFVKDMADGLNSLAALVEGAVQDCAGVMEAVASGDLTRRS